MKRECLECGREFELIAGKPGLSTTCWNCSVETVEKKAGITVWYGKHTPVTIVTSRSLAREYQSKNSRFAFSVMKSITPKRDPFEPTDPGSKIGTGAEKRAIYRSNLGEKRSVKD